MAKAEERKRIYDSLDHDNWKIVSSDEYKAYIKALCRLASGYVSKIRVKFAVRAFEKYADPTIRKLVLAYGKEAEKLDESRLFDFKSVSEYGPFSDYSLSDSCLCHAHEYGEAIWFLFGIDDDEGGDKDEAGSGN